jgi:hypothetical protein
VTVIVTATTTATKTETPLGRLTGRVFIPEARAFSGPLSFCGA